MKKRAIVGIGMALLLGLVPLAGCDFGLGSGENTPSGGDEMKVTDMKPISYEMSQNSMRSGTGVSLVLPSVSDAFTGRNLTANVKLEQAVENYNYYIVDWGDGTWSYNGPYVYNDTYSVVGDVYHTYKKPGSYKVRAAGVNLATGRLYGWTDAQTLVVSGEDWEGELITEAVAIASGASSEETGPEKVADGRNETYWSSPEAASVATQDYVGYLFDGYYTLDTIEIKTPVDAPIFPSNIAIEYTTDGGETWHFLPHYFYELPNEPNYSCIMKFPNPMGATLVLNFDGIVANGVRVRSVMYPLAAAGAKTFRISELRAYGTRDMLFYTSRDGYYNADLNNMWSIYGLAKTEPRMYNSLRGATTNVNPFRSGQTMTASIEWTEWNGDKLNWTDYAEAEAIHVNSLKNAISGGDGWYKGTDGKYYVDENEYENRSIDDGFIFATENASKSGAMHLGEQNHYTNNSTLIIACRDYLLQGNDTLGFLESVNSRGQVMLEKLRHAADYMINTLDGKSGVMTIFDPRNDGTVYGVASNYWDSLNCFGWQSAYENILYYRSLLAMADIETYIGERGNADYYTSIAALVKEKFNETFWDAAKGRYITSINKDGDRIDFGFTPLNFMAAACGLADKEQLEQIYDWVDGKRIIEGDNSTGEDIYAFKVSARSNTYAIENLEKDGLHYWWYNGHSFNDVLPGHWGEYGQQMQNGGTIFYTSHYDIMGRTNLSTARAIERFDAIMKEFHIDELRRDPQTKWGGYLVSILGEFPESGLVPLTFLTGFVGVEPSVKGLKISPNLPADMEYAGVNEYHYGNRVYAIEVNRTLRMPEVRVEGEKYIVRLPADRTYYITLQNKLIEE